MSTAAAVRRPRVTTVLAVVVALLAALAVARPGSTADAAPSATAPLTVRTSSGTLHGLATATAREFLGVRYAQPPTGQRRWTLPVAAAAAPGVVDATRAGASCTQTGSNPATSPTSDTSEDCLFLNVTTPKTVQPGEKLPVMVWWHGGGYTSGSGAAYDAQRLASQGHVVVVTVNYRLGVFGYLSLPGLAGSGNFGLADQILATRWAEQNAAAFGGNPDNLTVFGESAGAMSACAFLESPAAVGLVDRVAMSSGGSCQLDWPQDTLLPGLPPQTPYTDLASGEELGTAEAARLGCTGAGALTCLRGTSVTKLLTIFPDFANVLAYGTPLLPHDPAEAVRSGQVVHVPVLSNGNHDEERAFVGGAELTQPFFTAATYPRYLRSAFGADASRVARQYPLSDYPNAATAWSTLVTDATWACQTLTGNAALAAHGSRVFATEFDDPDAPDINGVTTPDFDPRAAHATDLPYLFDLGGKNLLVGARQKALAAQMIGYWSTFARTGSPYGYYRTVDWPAVTGPDGPVFRLQPGGNGVADVAGDHRCAFWRGIGTA